MKRSFALLTMLAVLAASVLAVPAVAAAQTVGIIQYQVEYTPAEGWLVIAAVADPQAELPVTVLIPVPEGATLMWSGEVDSDADIDDDPPRTATLRSVNGVDAYELTLESGYAAQLELVIDGTRVPAEGGDGRLVWRNPYETTALVYPAIVFPQTATGLHMAPAGTGVVQTGEGTIRYSLQPQRVAAGSDLVLEAGWGADAGAGGATTATPPAWLIAALAAALVALVFAVVIDRTKARRRAIASGAGTTEDASPVTDESAAAGPARGVDSDGDDIELDW